MIRSMRYASVRSRLEPLLPRVEKPGRYVGLERNVTRKEVALCKAVDEHVCRHSGRNSISGLQEQPARSASRRPYLSRKCMHPAWNPSQAAGQTCQQPGLRAKGMNQVEAFSSEQLEQLKECRSISP